MSVSKKSLLALFLIFLAGSAIGFIAGAYTGGNFGVGVVINNTINRDARDVKTLLGSLRELRAGETAAAIETIETLVYDHLIVFEPDEPYPGIQATTEAEVEAAINAAYEYWKAFPRDSQLATDEFVESLFRSRGLD